MHTDGKIPSLLESDLFTELVTGQDEAGNQPHDMPNEPPPIEYNVPQAPPMHVIPEDPPTAPGSANEHVKTRSGRTVKRPQRYL